MIPFIKQAIRKGGNMHTRDKKSFTEHLSNPKIMRLVIISMVIIGYIFAKCLVNFFQQVISTISMVFLGFFFANFLLHFLQQVLHLIDDFAKNPEKVNFNMFSVDWHHFFIFQQKWVGFYVVFYIVVGISVVKLLYNMKMNYQSINKGQHGTNEFEKVKNMKKQYLAIPSKTEEYEGTGGTIIAGLHTGSKYQLLIDDAPVHTMVIGITRSGKGETFV